MAGVGAIDEADNDLRAAVYARTSSTSQRFGYSIGEQVRQCIDRCEMLGWEPVFVFRDEAKSGKDTDRPMFQEMLTSAEQGAFDVLVFWKLDRFSRSIMHAVQLENEFRDWGIALHSVTEQLDTTTAAGRFNFRNIANAAEFERDMIKQRTKMGHTALAMEHKWPNSTPPLGYERLDNGLLQVHPREAALVRHIYHTYLDEESMPSVATKLNESGLTKREGGKWSPSEIGSILQNRIYTGVYAVGNVTSDVEEYRILSKVLFNEVTTVRQRFQGDGQEDRHQMEPGRKRGLITGIINQYFEFLHSSE